ncbi:MAG: DUF2723 domain-containing protein [Elusimicrobiota bacterium]
MNYRTQGYCLLFLIIFGTYLFTAYPTVPPYRDSGDLITSGVTLGIAHPPGYPLYTISGKIFTVIVPFGNFAYRINLLSIFSGAMTCVLVCVFLTGILNSFYPGFIAGLLLAFSPAFWALSHVSEMYTLLSLFGALIFLLLVAGRHPDDARVYPAAFVFGLGLGSHPTLILFLPGILLFLWGRRSRLNPFYVLLFFVLGCTVFAYLPLRASAEPVLNWGDPKTIRNFLRLVTRADYGGLKLHPEQSRFIWSAGSVLAQFKLFGQAMIQQFTLPVAIAGIAGMYYSFRKQYRGLASLLVTCFLVTGILFFLLSNLPPEESTTLPILEPHLVLPNMIFVLFVGMFVTVFLPAKRDNATAGGMAVCRPVLVAAVVVFSALACVFVFFRNFGEHNRREHFFAYDYGKNILKTMPAGSLLYDPDDSPAFIVKYLRMCENKRKDIKPVMYFRTLWGYKHIRKHYPEILPGYEIGSAQELMSVLVDYNLDKRDIYADVITKIPSGYVGFPAGLLYRINAPGDDGVREKFNHSENLYKLYACRGRFDSSLYKDFFTRRIFYYYAASHNNIALEYTRHPSLEGATGGALKKAEGHYYRAVSIDPHLSVGWNNLGALAFRNGEYVKAVGYFGRALAINPKEASVYYNIGLSYKAAGDVSLAEEYFVKSNEVSFYPFSLNELGLIALGRGEISKAIEYFERIIVREPSFSPAYFNLGLACEKGGDFARAVHFYKRYTEQGVSDEERRETEAIIKRLRGRRGMMGSGLDI